MNNEEKIQKARRLFPIGTKFDNSNIDGNGIGIVGSEPEFWCDTSIFVKDEKGAKRFIYDLHKWAEILKPSIAEKLDPQYEIY